jgi:hypothetical protein
MTRTPTDTLPPTVVVRTFATAAEAAAFRQWLDAEGLAAFAAHQERQTRPVLPFDEFAAPPQDTRRPVLRMGPIGVWRPANE